MFVSTFIGLWRCYPMFKINPTSQCASAWISKGLVLPSTVSTKNTTGSDVRDDLKLGVVTRVISCQMCSGQGWAWPSGWQCWPPGSPSISTTELSGARWGTTSPSRSHWASPKTTICTPANAQLSLPANTHTRIALFSLTINKGLRWMLPYASGGWLCE